MSANPKIKTEGRICSLCNNSFSHDVEDHVEYPEQFHCHVKGKDICETCIRRITEGKETGYTYKTLMETEGLSRYEISKILRVIK